MTAATDKQIVSTLEALNDMLEHRLPAHLPERAPEWRLWLAVCTVVFYGGISWYQIQETRDILRNHIIADIKGTSILAGRVKSGEDGLVAHMQWELEHELDLRTKEIDDLKSRKQ